MKWNLIIKFLASIIATVVATLLCFVLVVIFFSYKTSRNPDEILKIKAPNITASFESKIQFVNGSIYIEENELDELRNLSSWIQVLDENGIEIYNRLKPEYAPNHYTPGELVHYHMYSGTIEGYTLFIGLLEKEGRNFTYVIGFPHRQVEKYSFNFNPENITKNTVQLIITTVIVFIAISAIIGYLLSLKLTKPILSIMENIKSLSKGEFNNGILDIGIYEDVALSLKYLSETLKVNELEQKNTEKMREEWIANITHDIRTPLSSIKGYSELLLDNEYSLSMEEREKYAEVILSKANYIDGLVEDLKLTYQLKNVRSLLERREVNLVDILRETIIDILNNPKYENADIIFEPNTEDIVLDGDGTALKRAFTNIIYNALVHNEGNTKVWVRLSRNEDIVVEIKDNGKGIAEEELKKLFQRYYRGTNTGEQHRGSGLGMSISKQIIESHGGKIEVSGMLGRGTTVKIILTRDKS